MNVRQLAGAGPQALILVAAVSLAACEVNLNSEGIVSRETKTFKTSGVPDVQLDTFDGAIEVHSWDKGEVEVEIEEQVPDLEQRIICYCGGGSRSALVTESLQKMGYRNVRSMTGGFRGWKTAGLPTAVE